VAAPAMAQIEWVVIRWFCSIVGYPDSAGGFLTTGGSLANWSALVTARRLRMGDDVQQAAIYTSDQAHHSVAKAAIMAGFPAANLRSVDTDARYRLRIDDLQRLIQLDRQQGFRPFAIVGSAGTTNTGAIDDLTALATVSRNEGLWLHVDAAYGGFFALTQRGGELMQGLDQADSITLDPHKGLFLPYGTGGLLVRDSRQLEAAHRVDGDYMPPMQAGDEFVDFCNISPELSREWRGLRIWLPLQMHGTAAFREALDEKLDLARWAAEQLQQIDCGEHQQLDIVAQPELSIVAFRLRRAGLAQDEINALNRRLLERINQPRRVFLTATVLDGDFAIRICVLSFRTHLQQMQECLALIKLAIEHENGRMSNKQ
jgi:aromatic-L-amino-acid decarboxylase